MGSTSSGVANLDPDLNPGLPGAGCGVPPPTYQQQNPSSSSGPADDGTANFPSHTDPVDIENGPAPAGQNPLDLSTSTTTSSTNPNQPASTSLSTGATSSSTLTRTNATPGTPGHINTGGVYGYRHFTFILNDQTTSNILSLDLNFNPEDLAYETPYRVYPVQTAGGIFIDVWGQGIRKIIIRGHTGWRTVQTPTQQQDGFDNIFSLRDQIIEQYFTARSTASQTMSQKDVESKIKLTIVDRLHEKAYSVVPENFRLLRNRQRPLLHMYEASFFIVQDDTANQQVVQQALSGQNLNQQMSSALGSLQSIFSTIATVAAIIGGSFSVAMATLTSLGAGVATVFQGLLTANQQLVQGVVGITTLVIEATQAINSGLGIISAFTDYSQLSIDAQSVFSDVKAAFAELNCILNQITDGGLFTYSNYSGSSYCGTLSGGTVSPLATTTNSFDTILNPNGTQNASTVSAATQAITPTAQQLSQNINSIDGPALLIGRG